MDASQALLEELECKKMYKTEYVTKCYWCEVRMEEDEPLWFFGDGRKTCEECYQAIHDFICD